MYKLVKIIPAVRMIASGKDYPCFLKYSDDQKIQPDSLSIDNDGTVEGIIASCKTAIENFRKEKSKLPGSLNITGIGRIEIISEPGISSSPPSNGIKNKIAIVTGGAQGFGGGISEELYQAGVNVVIADVNEQAGKEKANSLNTPDNINKVIFVRTDVSDPGSVENLVYQTVKQFGGIDILVSNAGILHAGSLDEMEPEVFDKMTEVNYNAFFLCVKYTSEVLKTQNKYNPDYYTDIIQINSKSGLRGSKKNFAYAGAKFGGLGLVQSFALELVEHKIKVNAICPGNFFEGPLWADPENGLFVQYLKAGKVPGAKNTDDVKRHYESLVPMNRGCRIEDVMTAIYYVINQKYETGQAVPVTGGQVMLS